MTKRATAITDTKKDITETEHQSCPPPYGGASTKTVEKTNGLQSCRLLRRGLSSSAGSGAEFVSVFFPLLQVLLRKEGAWEVVLDCPARKAVEKSSQELFGVFFPPFDKARTWKGVHKTANENANNAQAKTTFIVFEVKLRTSNQNAGPSLTSV